MLNQKSITVYAANCRGNPTNCLYPHRIEITGAVTAAEAFSRDIVCAEYKKAVLEKERRMLENKVSKGKADASELAEKAKEIAAFQEIQPLKLFVDDVTAEKLASVLAENRSKAAIVSAEGGIFDILSGIYTKNVNIDVLLKGHSGDTIRVDRIGRANKISKSLTRCSSWVKTVLRFP